MEVDSNAKLFLLHARTGDPTPFLESIPDNHSCSLVLQASECTEIPTVDKVFQGILNFTCGMQAFCRPDKLKVRETL